jgi:hypothetical protein
VLRSFRSDFGHLFLRGGAPSIPKAVFACSKPRRPSRKKLLRRHAPVIAPFPRESAGRVRRIIQQRARLPAMSGEFSGDDYELPVV